MVLAALSLLAAVALAAPDWTDDGALVVVQETRTPEAGKKSWTNRKQARVRHVAIVQNAWPRSLRGVRVTVELYDYFGQILWAGSAVPTPSTLKPGETATLSLLTPSLERHRTTRYRFDYQGRGTRR